MKSKDTRDAYHTLVQERNALVQRTKRTKRAEEDDSSDSSISDDQDGDEKMDSDSDDE